MYAELAGRAGDAFARVLALPRLGVALSRPGALPTVAYLTTDTELRVAVLPGLRTLIALAGIATLTLDTDLVARADRPFVSDAITVVIGPVARLLLEVAAEATGV